MTTIAVIGDITPEEARPVIEKWFGAWKGAGAKPDVTLPAVPANKPSAAQRAGSGGRCRIRWSWRCKLPMNRFNPDYYALQLGDHVLGGGFYATRLYRDLRQKAGYVYNVDNSLRAAETRATYSVTYGCDPGERFEGAGAGGAGPRGDAHGQREPGGTAAGQGAAAAADHAERIERRRRGGRLRGARVRWDCRSMNRCARRRSITR